MYAENPYDDAKRLGQLQQNLRKNPAADFLTLRKEIEARLYEANALGPTLAAGASVLDVGCGCGDTSLSLADTVGASGRVVGVDVSAPNLAVAQRRAPGRASR